MSDFVTDITNTAAFNTDFGGTNSFAPNFGVVTEVIVGDHYEGVYIATPTQAQQVFPTQGKILDEDFIVEPIPNNYGLVEWNGFFLKIS